MRCFECRAELESLSNAHLWACAGLTLQEYALRHHLPLDLLVAPDALNRGVNPDTLPPALPCPRERARCVLQGLRLAGLVQVREPLVIVPGEIRCLELLLWEQQYLADFGFQFFQEYEFDQSSNRVVARNRLVTLAANLHEAPPAASASMSPPDLDLTLAVFLAHAGWLQAGYLFFGFGSARAGAALLDELSQMGVAVDRVEDIAEPGIELLLRTRTPADTRRTLERLRPHFADMPGVWERFSAPTPELTVVKELPFDAAHFITDHPAKCSNLHGGRYVLHVKVQDRVDPVSGCVLDYGYLKRVVTRRIIERFDHHSLNYVAAELAWRSSTELLCVYIWERIIDCLPALVELTLYETPQSWCSYRGPSLAEFQRDGRSVLLNHFQDPALGQSPLRRALVPRDLYPSELLVTAQRVARQPTRVQRGSEQNAGGTEPVQFREIDRPANAAGGIKPLTDAERAQLTQAREVGSAVASDPPESHYDDAVRPKGGRSDEVRGSEEGVAPEVERQDDIAGSARSVDKRGGVGKRFASHNRVA